MSSQASFVILGVTVHVNVMAVIIVLAVAGCVEMVVWGCGDMSTHSSCECERIKKSCEFEMNLENNFNSLVHVILCDM